MPGGKIVNEIIARQDGRAIRSVISDKTGAKVARQPQKT
ncbi:hypothetical protein SF123566_2072 [Shigella flexneri 1235-66]|nr:hypothetical protein SF123566_2072 [Shigella flexneri 1235-66]